MRSMVWTFGCMCGLITLFATVTDASADVPKTGLERLSTGANITRWFTAWDSPSTSHYKSYMSDDEIAMMRTMGLRHVRLCFAPEYLYDPSHPDTPISDHLALVEEAIQRMNAHDLAVVLDPHNTDEKRIEDDAASAGGFPAFWGALAEALAWGRQHKVPLYCGEVGVYPLNAPPESRRNWFRDYASVLQESGVGYSVWGWDDAFGLGRKLDGGRVIIDTVPAEALGLR